MVYTPGFFSS